MAQRPGTISSQSNIVRTGDHSHNSVPIIHVKLSQEVMNVCSIHMNLCTQNYVLRAREYTTHQRMSVFIISEHTSGPNLPVPVLIRYIKDNP